MSAVAGPRQVVRGGPGGPPVPPAATRGSRVRRTAALVLVHLLAAVALVVLWPSNLGGCTTVTVVRGQSMEPALRDGDVVVTRCGTPQVGDVVIYAPDGYDGARIVHRVVGGGPDGWTVQGDNNAGVDPFRPSDDEVVGVAVATVPHVGAATAVLTHPGPWAAMVLVALLLVAWPPRGRV